MSAGPKVADQIRQSRTSIVTALFSAGAIFYSTQIQLQHGYLWWNMPIAGVGVALFVASMWMTIHDWRHEQSYRESQRREQEAKADLKEVESEERRMDIARDEEGPGPAAIQNIDQELPESEEDPPWVEEIEKDKKND